MSNSGKCLVTEDGTIQHVRLIGIYKMRHPELKKLTNSEIMEKYNWKYLEISGKYRYVYLRGSKKDKRKMYKLIEDKIKEYPKL